MGGDGLDAQKQIKKLMEERGWTDYRLAKESGLSHSTVTNMFNRNNAPTLPTLEAVCRAFGITLALSTPVRFCSFSPNMECRKMAGKRVQLLNNYTCRFRPSSLKRADKSGLDRLQAGK